MNKIREGLPPIPKHMSLLKISDKGYPIPWFVQYIDGKPDFRVMDATKIMLAYKFLRCWVCGGPLGVHKSFVVGPMCAVNRTSAEPPSHHECAVFSAMACPFLTLPKAVRREANMPNVATNMAGHGILRNPGVTCVWTVRKYSAVRTPEGPLFRIGEPESVEWYAEKQKAAREQVMASIDSGMPALRALVIAGSNDELLLDRAYEKALAFVPEEAA